MPALITVSNSDGVVGRCDAKCYNARSPDCDCVCGGANHGKGYQIAAEQTEHNATEWIPLWNAAHPDAQITHCQTADGQDPRQPLLF